MKAFLKENFVLVVGIALPLVLIALFFIAGQVTRMAAADPQYDAVFAIDYYHNAAERPFDISVDSSGNIVIKSNDVDDDLHYQVPQLLVFDHETLSVRPLDIDFDLKAQGTITAPDLEELNQHRIDPSPVSPDGYAFEYNYRSSNGIFGEIFGFGYRSRSQYALRNGLRVIPVESTTYFYQAHFLGWVIDE